MKLFWLLLISFATLDSFTARYTPVKRMNSQDNNPALNYLALGDSYTIGEAVPTELSFPYQLVGSLNNGHTHINPPTIIATTGWTTDELINAIAESGITHKKYDFVTLLIGVNDQYRAMSRDNYRTKFEQVLNTAIKFADGHKDRVFVLSIPDWGVTPFASGREGNISKEIDQFNAINKQISFSLGVNYLDISDISRRAATESDLIATDGLHPSAKMYAEWVGRLAPIVAKKLN